MWEEFAKVRKNARKWPHFRPVTFDLLTYDLDPLGVTRYYQDTCCVKISSRSSNGNMVKSWWLPDSLTHWLTENVTSKGWAMPPKNCRTSSYFRDLVTHRRSHRRSDVRQNGLAPEIITATALRRSSANKDNIHLSTDWSMPRKNSDLCLLIFTYWLTW